MRKMWSFLLAALALTGCAAAPADALPAAETAETAEMTATETEETAAPPVGFTVGNLSEVPNTCGGYSFYKDAKLLRLTRYRYNNVPADSNGRYFYLKEGNSIWNPGWQPTQTPLDL